MLLKKVRLFFLRTIRRIFQKLLRESLLLIRSFWRKDYRTYRAIRRFVEVAAGKRHHPNAAGVRDRKRSDRYIMWNNPISGFSHQTSVYVMGLVIARLLNRKVILNYMLLNLYHNRGYDRLPKLCDPKIYFNWEKLNEAVKVLTPSDFSASDMLLNTSKEQVHAIDLNQQYDSDVLLVSDTNGAKQFFHADIIPDGILQKCDAMTQYLGYSSDIKHRARVISDALGDYDAIHIRRGDMLHKDSILLNNTLTPDEVASKTDLSCDIEKLKRWIEPGRKLYIATDEKDKSFFNALSNDYDVYFIINFMDVVANEMLPTAARDNSYYILCIEELVLCNARRFVGALPVSTTRKVDKMRMNFSGIDRNIYNLSSAQYLEYAKNRDIWCVSLEELRERLQV